MQVINKGTNGYLFADEDKKNFLKPEINAGGEIWKVLIVDDKEENHRITRKALEDLIYESKKISFLNAYSIEEAKKVLLEHPDITLLFLNVHMKKIDSGSPVIEFIRKKLENRLMRIILRTDRIGYAPKKSIMFDYDISGYQEKADLTPEKIYLSVLLCLRSYRDLIEIESNKRQLKEADDAVARFVPRKFLQILKKESIKEIKISDHIEKEMTILFLDIRSFTSLTEFSMPQDMFEFINDCMSYLEPFIIKHNGFIDKYIGDAIMALFPDSADDAIQAGIDMLQSLDNYNYSRIINKKIPIKIGIGISTGLVVLGAVGHDRMDCTVIGSPVNVAERVEKANKMFGTTFLISERTLIATRHPDQFSYRSLGKVRLPGKNERVHVIEIFDSDPTDVKLHKTNTKTKFEEGVQLYQTGDFMQAKHLFKQICDENRHDEAAKFFMSSCKS